MSEDINEYIGKVRSHMDESISHLESELAKVRAGKASPNMLNGIMVAYYGNPTPINQVANISTADSRTLVVQPWEKSIIPDVERAIFEANLGVTPQNDGEIIRLSVPPLTEERRKELVKRAKSLGEDAKVGVRHARQKGMDAIKKAVKDGLPEDAGKRLEDDVQKFTNNHTSRIDEILASKEKDIMTI